MCKVVFLAPGRALAQQQARVLLDESSVRFLAEADADAPAFEERFAAYESWLAREDAPVGGAPAFVV